ncbi:hypothetical protein cyc_08148 [Cyclospora cayetanensis]|uniref:Transmembrane protein n=1 Tax=Cyclospora cayetanensis TaxID=88456 RepID=A0A1D3D0J3_9EIME|nr:hypothetical protein cyc_08148 [Cyclospora cayetanensis]
MAHLLIALLVALVPLLVPLQRLDKTSLVSFADASDKGRSGGGGDDTGSGDDTPEETTEEKDGKKSEGADKGKTDAKKPNALISAAFPLLWNAAASAVVASEDPAELEEFNAALSRIFSRHIQFPPKYSGSLEVINDAIADVLLKTNTKMSLSDLQRLFYSRGGRGTYMQLPELLTELRQAADHVFEEQRRIKTLNRLRRRGVPISVDDLKLRPFVQEEYSGPVTTSDIENISEAEIQQRQARVNGWLQMLDMTRFLQRQQLRMKGPVKAEPINDDDIQATEEDVHGLSFTANLSDASDGVSSGRPGKDMTLHDHDEESEALTNE